MMFSRAKSKLRDLTELHAALPVNRSRGLWMCRRPDVLVAELPCRGYRGESDYDIGGRLSLPILDIRLRVENA